MVRCPVLFRKGVTLAELLVVVALFLPSILATVLVFVRCLQAIELSQNISRAVNEVQNEISLIEAVPFSQVLSTYNQQSFTSQTLTGKGICYVQSVDSNMLQVTVSMSWREKNARIVGEDLDLDGVLDNGEDTNGNGQLDSPVKLTTMIYNL